MYIGSLAFCGVGHGQQPGNGNPLDPDEESPSAQQVVVTASKRPETLTQAPMAISVLTQEQLQRTGAEEIQNLMSLVPAFEVQTVGAANSIQLAIRGVTNSDFNAGNPAVATYVDGIYIGRTQGLNYGLYDLERIEVLRGPQGTLYGRNATGGNVNIITADPRKSFGASVTCTEQAALDPQQRDGSTGEA
jgi:iron complex outermembrane recepter protein